MGTLEIQNLTKSFSDDDNEIIAVENFNATIEDGEFLVLVGPSGCGKSTTLRSIAGLETPTTGEIVLDGETGTDKEPKDRDMAMVFQSYALYPHMTARENMSFGLKMSTDMGKRAIEEQVTEIARIMGIENLLEKKPGELSGGQQQWVALGRAIVREPEVFLMDEPLSNLDAKLRTQMRTELQELQQEFGVTTVYVTHDQTEAMTMADRIAVLNDGRLQQIGTPMQCYHQPENLFVAGFIGSPSMNVFDVDLDESGEVPRLVHGSFEYELDEETYTDVRDVGPELTLGVRPEDIQIVSEGDHNAVSTQVRVTEPLGDITYLYLDIGGDQYTATVDGDIMFDTDRPISVAFPQDRIHLFDRRTGEALHNRKPPEGGEFSVSAFGEGSATGAEIGAE